MLSFFILTTCVATRYSYAEKVKLIKSWSLASSAKIDKLKVGGLSGCVKKNDRIFFISDDRGVEGAPRIISFPWIESSQNLNLKAGHNLILKVKNFKTEIVDLEGIGISEVGDFLLSNEGDLNKKPRQGPSIFWINKDGVRKNNIKLTDNFLPNKSGQQTKGIQNNLGFEGLTVDPELKLWGAILEAPRLVEKNKTELYIDFIEGDLHSDNIGRIYQYPPVEFDELMAVAQGVTDLLYINKNKILTLERAAEMTLAGLSFQSQLCLADKTEKLLFGSEQNSLKKSCFYSMSKDPDFLKKYKKVSNFEGLCWLNEKKTRFLVVSDNNFSKNENTLFLLYDLQ